MRDFAKFENAKIGQVVHKPLENNAAQNDALW